MDSLRLPGQSLSRLHELLDRSENRERSANPSRMWRRWSLGVTVAEATFRHPGGNVVRCLVSPRTLSAGGIGLLHGGFVHVGTPVTTHMAALNGERRDIPGKVVRCRHIGRHIHEVGVKFNDRIEPRDFIGLGDTDDAFVLEKVDAKQIHGKVLVVTENRAVQRLIAHMLRNTRVEAEYVEDFQSGLESAKNAFDLILADYHLSGSGAVFVNTLRETQIVTPVIMMSADTSQPVLQESRDAGASAMLGTPLEELTLHRALAEFLVLRGGLAVGAGSIISEKSGDESMRDLISAFVNDLDRLADEITEALRGNDSDRVRKACLLLKGSGASHGFPLVSNAAASALFSISQAQALTDASAELRRLVEICRRCTTG